MIWLASYPRSGNTFARNILYEVYGIESSTFHFQTQYPLDSNYDKFDFVKTHELPSLIKPVDESIPAIYIVRDGRDALISMAHHRKNIISPGSDFYENLREAIVAQKGSFFGGWSKNVRKWVARADLIIRFEDLIKDPLSTTERIRAIYDLPKPQIEKIPSFEQLKYGIPKYGAGREKNISEEEKIEKAGKFFRKGKVGGWKKEMPEELFDLFWSFHGDEMDRLGYSFDGSIKAPHPELDWQLIGKLGKNKPVPGVTSKKILIESNKIVSAVNDGVKRYQIELLKGFLPLAENPGSGWIIDLYINKKIIPLLQLKESIIEGFKSGEKLNEKLLPLLQIEESIVEDFNEIITTENEDVDRDKSFFERLEQMLIKSMPQKFIKILYRNDIKIFHNTYEFLRKLLILTISRIISFINYIKRILYPLYHNFKRSIGNFTKDDQFDQYDLIHLPLMHHYFPFHRTRTKILVTVHDLTHIFFPQHHTEINISNSKKGLNFTAENNAAVIAISNSTKNDLLKECNIDPGKVHMVYEAADREKFRFRTHKNDTKIAREKYGIGDLDNYLISLSTIEPRKNIENTIKGFRLLLDENPDIPLHLVIAGEMGWKNNEPFLRDLSSLSKVLFIGFVDDEDISAIYSDALAMSYLSFYEGFGLPPLEAMCCGTPVIYGNNSSLIEVVGQGGLACDPYDTNDIKEKFGQIFFDKELREQKSKDALKQSLQFSWRKTVMETLDIYKQIIEKGEAASNN